MPGSNGTPPPVLDMQGIDKHFPGVQALADASLRIAAGEVHGLVGENGAGKSTIIKVLAGVYPRDAGEVRVDGTELDEITPSAVHDLGVRFIHQELHLVPHFSVAESVFMGTERTAFGLVRRREMRARAEAFLAERLGATIDGRTLVRDLGPAERKLVQIARALVDEGARLVVFDEPTAPLAAAEIGRVFAAVRRLREQGIASLYVSHYLAEITELCDRVTVFRNGTDVGSLDALDEHRHRELIRLMVGRELDRMFPERDAARGEVVLATEWLGDERRFRDINLTVHRGEIVGLAGLLGSGREELVDTLSGLRRARTGTIRIADRAARLRSPADALARGLALVPRDRRSDGLVLDMSASDNINLAALDDVASAGWLHRGEATARASDMVTRLDVRPPETTRAARLFSGGNQQKLVLARWLAADADVLVFDEPTVGVDIGAKAEIYRLMGELTERGAGLLVSSNDLAELLGICDRIVVLVRGEIVATVIRGEVDLDELVALTTGGSPAAAGAVEPEPDAPAADGPQADPAPHPADEEGDA